MNVPVSRPLLDARETELVNDAMVAGDISGYHGKFIKEFETKFAEFISVKHAVTVSNGTTALHLALATIGITAGDEVLVSTFTNMATVFSILYQGAVPVPIDCEPDTWNIDSRLLEAKITSRTRVILVVHIFGHPVDMGPVMAVARANNLFVVEDVAEAHGAEYNGKRVGGIGDIAAYSFYANKILTTGEGGMVTTNNDEWAARARSLKSLAFGTQNKFMHDDVGFNYRLPNLQCAIGVAQLEKWEDIKRRKREMAAFYLDALKDISELQLPVEKLYAFNMYWMFLMVLRGALKGKRAAVMAQLKSRGVETREGFVPANEQNVLIARGITKPADCPIASSFASDSFYIPSGTNILKEEMQFVAQQVREVVEQLRV